MEKFITESAQPKTVNDMFAQVSVLVDLANLPSEDIELVNLLKPLVREFPLSKTNDPFGMILVFIYNGVAMTVTSGLNLELQAKFNGLTQKKLVELIVYAFLDGATPEERDRYLASFGIQISETNTQSTTES